MFGCTLDRQFIIKCLLRDAPLAYILSALFGATVFFGYVGMICESPLDRLGLGHQPYGFFNACWVVICTFFTSGYGEIYPKTPLGRLFGVFNILFGVFIVSILVVT